MGRGHGGSRGSRPGGGMSARANELSKQYLGKISDPALRKELAEGMAAFEKEFGIPVFGNGEGRGGLVIVSSDLGERTYGKVNGMGFLEINSRFASGQMDMGHAKHTMIHELTHGLDKTNAWNLQTSTWSQKNGGSYVLKSENKGFDRKLTAAYKHFKSHFGRSESAQQLGSYALKSKHEFFAEALAHHMTGTQNQYTSFAYNLAKSMAGR